MNGSLVPRRFSRAQGNAFGITPLPRKNTTKSKWRRNRKKQEMAETAFKGGARSHSLKQRVKSDSRSWHME